MNSRRPIAIVAPIFVLIALTTQMSGCGGGSIQKIMVSSPDFANSGFETPNLGADVWEYEPTDFIWTGSATGWGMANQATSWGTAHSGSQFAMMQGAATLSQTISGLTIGHNYRVTFWSCTRDGDVGANTTEPIGVLADGNAILAPFNPAGPGQWTKYLTQPFTATQTSVTVTFQTQDPAGVDSTDLLDDVHLVDLN